MENWPGSKNNLSHPTSKKNLPVRGIKKPGILIENNSLQPITPIEKPEFRDIIFYCSPIPLWHALSAFLGTQPKNPLIGPANSAYTKKFDFRSPLGLI